MKKFEQLNEKECMDIVGGGETWSAIFHALGKATGNAMKLEMDKERYQATHPGIYIH